MSRPFTITITLSLSAVHLAGTLSCHIGLMLLQHPPTKLGVVTYVAHPAPTYDVSRPFQGNPSNPGPWISTKVVNQIQVQGHRPKWAAHWAFVVVKEPRHFYRDRSFSVLKPDMAFRKARPFLSAYIQASPTEDILVVHNPTEWLGFLRIHAKSQNILLHIYSRIQKIVINACGFSKEV